MTDNPKEITTPSDSAPALLTITLNHVPKGEVPVIIKQDDILVRVSDLTTAGLLTIPGHTETREGVVHISLRSMAPLLTYQFNDETLALALSADPTLLPLTTLALFNPRPPNILYTSTPSFFVNYAVDTIDFHAPSVFIESGASLFGRVSLHGTLSHTPTAGLLRGLTTLTFDDRPHLARITLGDTTLFTSDLGSGALFGGIAIMKEYSLDPYINRAPNLTLQGVADTPSTAEIYSNGTLVSRLELQPGRFSFNQLPLLPGQRTVRLVIRDVFGREREISQSSYFVPTLLAKGFQEYRYGAGIRRTNLGLTSFDYDIPVALAFHRIGITDDVTIGWRAEASNGLFSGGPLLAGSTPYGQFALEAAASTDHSQTGYAGLFSYGYTAKHFSVGASAAVASQRYAKIDTPATSDRPLFQLSAFAGIQATDTLNTSLQYTRLHFRDQGDTNRLSASAQLKLSSTVSLLLSAGRTSTTPPDSHAPLRTDYNVGLSFTFALGRNTTATAQSTTDLHHATSTITYQKHLPQNEGYGYRASVGLDSQLQPQVAAIGQYQSLYGRYEATATHTHDTDHLALHVAGALAIADGLIAASRPIDGAFAIIDTGDLTGVRTYINRAETGRTDVFGRLTLPRLQPYLANDITIADYDIPPDHQVDTFKARIAPPQHGGAAIRFLSRPFRAIQGRLVRQDGTGELPISGGQLTLIVDGNSMESPLGYGGEFYLEHVPQGHYNATVQLLTGRCITTIIVPPPSESLITDLGRIVCTPTPEPAP